MAGTLFVVATPIGNLEDLTFRALRVLKEVDLIAAEDTRRTAKLLAHYEVRKPVVSVREHNESREAGRLVSRLTRGENVALVTDAGTPGIADPGARVVAAAHAAGIRVVPIPGASAVTAALSASGFGGDEFVFMGFPPPSGRDRQAWFARLAAETRQVVIFEAPHRIKALVGDIAQYASNRRHVVARELTKIHENIVVRPIMYDASDETEPLGEFVVVIGPVADSQVSDVDASSAAELFYRLTELAGLEREIALDVVAHVLNVPVHKLSNSIKKHAISVKRQREPLP